MKISRAIISKLTRTSNDDTLGPVWTSPSLYAPLPATQFRVLRCTQTGLWTLVTRDITDVAPFSALSYQWSTQPASHALLINQQWAVISSNVHQFLDQQRDGGIMDDVFVDCICINQNDLKERGEQVKLMGEIYARAETVYLWFSDSPCGVTIESMLEVQGGYEVWKEWYAKCMRHLYSAEYWTRTWIVQEFMLADRVVFRCGDDCLRKAGLGGCLADMNVQMRNIRAKREGKALEEAKDDFFAPMEIRRGEEWPVPHGEMYKLVESNAVQLFHQREKMDSRLQDSSDSDEDDAEAGLEFRHSEDQTMGEPLAKVLLSYLGTACGDRRDVIYGFLGLCTAADRNIFSADTMYSPDFDLESLFLQVMSCCNVHLDFRLAFAHSIRDNLGLNESTVWKPRGATVQRSSRLSKLFRMQESAALSARKPHAADLVHARAWRVGIISHIGLANESLEHFTLCHAISENLRRSPGSQEKRDGLEVIRKVLQDGKLESLGKATAFDGTRLGCKRKQSIRGYVEKPDFKNVDVTFDIRPHASSEVQQAPTSSQPRFFACEDLVLASEAGGKARHWRVLSAAELAEGDIICHCVGLDVSLVFRRYLDEYIFVGKAYLEDSFHLCFAQGSGIRRQMRELMQKAYPGAGALDQATSGWRQFVAATYEEPFEDMVPEGLESLKLVMDNQALFDLCW